MKASKLRFHYKFQLILSNLKVNGIPTQSSRVFIRLKQYHSKKKTKPVEIKDNLVQWDEKVDIKCTLPKTIKKINHKYLLNISVRFENSSGRGFIQYGNVDIDISVLRSSQEFHVDLPLQNCMEKSDFSCDIFNENPLEECTEPSNSILQSSIAVNENSTSNETTPTSLSTVTNSADQSISEYSQYTEDNNNSACHSTSNRFCDKEVKVTVFDSIEVNVKELKLKEMESQVDYIVAQIINNTY